MKIDKMFVPGEKISIMERSIDTERKRDVETLYIVEEQNKNGVLCNNSYGIHRFIDNATLIMHGIARQVMP